MCKLGDRCKFKKWQAIFSNSLYEYASGGYYKNKVQIIQLGCYSRTRKEWDNDFWNNPNEFLDHNSEKSQARLRAFKTICFFLDQIEPY